LKIGKASTELGRRNGIEKNRRSYSLDIDWHVHTTNSCDSKINPRDACVYAEIMGLKGICFTEHIDFDPRDTGYNWFHWNAYIKEMEATKQEHPGFVHTGFELNWQEKFSTGLLDFLDDKAVDLVLGSVHWLKSGHICQKSTFTSLSLDAFLDEWIHEALDLLNRDICHGFAHFDYFYLFGQEFYPNLKRDDIFYLTEPVIDAIIKHDVSLEINSRVLRKGLSEPCPSWRFIENYFKAGGRKVHIGSDSHSVGEIGFQFDAIRTRLATLLANCK